MRITEARTRLENKGYKITKVMNSLYIAEKGQRRETAKSITGLFRKILTAGVIILCLYSCTTTDQVSRKEFDELATRVNKLAEQTLKLSENVNQNIKITTQSLTVMNKTDSLLFEKYQRLADAIITVNHNMVRIIQMR